MDELKAAFAKLEASIQKQWGDIPSEIQEEMGAISALLNSPPPPPPLAGSSAG